MIAVLGSCCGPVGWRAPASVNVGAGRALLPTLALSAYRSNVIATAALMVCTILASCSTSQDTKSVSPHAENTPVIAAGIAEINQELSRLRLVIVGGAPHLQDPTP